MKKQVSYHILWDDSSTLVYDSVSGDFTKGVGGWGGMDDLVKAKKFFVEEKSKSTGKIGLYKYVAGERYAHRIG